MKWVRPIIEIPEMPVMLFMISKVLSQMIKFCIKMKYTLFGVMYVHESMSVKSEKMISFCIIFDTDWGSKL